MWTETSWVEIWITSKEEAENNVEEADFLEDKAETLEDEEINKDEVFKEIIEDNLEV